MPVRCTSPFAANPQSIVVPGSAQLSIAVVPSDDVNAFDVDFVIVESDVGVQFASGGSIERRQVVVTRSPMTIDERVDFVCRHGEQFRSFHVEVRIRHNGVTQCVPAPQCTISVLRYECPPTLIALSGREHTVHAALVERDIDAGPWKSAGAKKSGSAKKVSSAKKASGAKKARSAPKRSRGKRAD